MHVTQCKQHAHTCILVHMFGGYHVYEHIWEAAIGKELNYHYKQRVIIYVPKLLNIIVSPKYKMNEPKIPAIMATSFKRPLTWH